MDIQSLISISISRQGKSVPLWVGFFTECPDKELLLQAIQRSENVEDFAIALVKHWDGSWSMQAGQTLPILFADIELGTITFIRLTGRLHTVKDTSLPRIQLEDQENTITASWTPYRPGNEVGFGATAAEAIGALVVHDKFVEIEETGLMDSRWSVRKSNFVE